MMRTAWAIALNDPQIKGYAGVFFFASTLQPYHDGVRTALFRTRAQARAALAQKGLKQSDYGYKKAAVVKVTVSIKRTAE